MAREYFEGEYNCAEAIIKAVNEYFDIECEHIPDIGSGFGAGMGGRGSVCGALVAGIISIGLIYSESELTGKDKKDAIIHKTLELFDTFESKYGGIDCSILIQFDVLKPDEIGDISNLNLRDLVQRGVIQIKCFDYVFEVCKFLMEVGNEALSGKLSSKNTQGE